MNFGGLLVTDTRTGSQHCERDRDHATSEVNHRWAPQAENWCFWQSFNFVFPLVWRVRLKLLFSIKRSSLDLETPSKDEKTFSGYLAYLVNHLVDYTCVWFHKLVFLAWTTVFLVCVSFFTVLKISLISFSPFEGFIHCNWIISFVFLLIAQTAGAP